MPRLSITPHYVALYKTDLCRGGHEEGGWYYTAGIRIGKAKAFFTEEAARKFIERAQRCMDAWHPENERELSSVLSEGRFEIYYHGDEMPEPFFPEKRPRYDD